MRFFRNPQTQTQIVSVLLCAGMLVGPGCKPRKVPAQSSTSGSAGDFASIEQDLPQTYVINKAGPELCVTSVRGTQRSALMSLPRQNDASSDVTPSASLPPGMAGCSDEQNRNFYAALDQKLNTGTDATQYGLVPVLPVLAVGACVVAERYLISQACSYINSVRDGRLRNIRISTVSSSGILGFGSGAVVAHLASVAAFQGIVVCSSIMAATEALIGGKRMIVEFGRAWDEDSEREPALANAFLDVCSRNGNPANQVGNKGSEQGGYPEENE